MKSENSATCETRKRWTDETLTAGTTKRFWEQVKRLHEQFNRCSSSTADVRAVLDRAAPIDEFMTRNRLASEAQNDWTLLRNKLDQLALAYNVRWHWDTYRMALTDHGFPATSISSHPWV
jgi:hypothetical protein